MIRPCAQSNSPAGNVNDIDRDVSRFSVCCFQHLSSCFWCSCRSDFEPSKRRCACVPWWLVGAIGRTNVWRVEVAKQRKDAFQVSEDGLTCAFQLVYKWMVIDATPGCPKERSFFQRSAHRGQRPGGIPRLTWLFRMQKLPPRPRRSTYGAAGNSSQPLVRVIGLTAAS